MIEEANFASNASKTQDIFILNHKTVRMPTAVRGDVHDVYDVHDRRHITSHHLIVLLRIIVLHFVCMFQCNPLPRFSQQTMAHDN